MRRAKVKAMGTSSGTQAARSPGLLQQVAATVLGLVVFSLGVIIAALGSVACYHADCHGSVSWLQVIGGWTIAGASSFLVAYAADRNRWIRRGALGLTAGAGAYLLFFAIAAAVDTTDENGAVLLVCFGLAAAVALPARTRGLLLGRVVGVIVLGLIPAAMDNLGVFVGRVHTYGGRGWQMSDRGWFLVPVAMVGTLAALFLPELFLHRREASRTAA